MGLVFFETFYEKGLGAREYGCSGPLATWRHNGRRPGGACVAMANLKRN
jgi:hypothetical protein